MCPTSIVDTYLHFFLKYLIISLCHEYRSVENWLLRLDYNSSTLLSLNTITTITTYPVYTHQGESGEGKCMQSILLP